MSADRQVYEQKVLQKATESIIGRRRKRDKNVVLAFQIAIANDDYDEEVRRLADLEKDATTLKDETAENAQTILQSFGVEMTALEQIMDYNLVMASVKDKTIRRSPIAYVLVHDMFRDYKDSHTRWVDTCKEMKQSAERMAMIMEVIKSYGL